ncbi:uncharacterized protein LOC142337678 isoform X2 [Convolutriloba macropyga]|uniref:uncharacterized protein LOC142337678 isoform X2 n=1 Tax=Convolutriloba macropyga TaxID=536237 RepID=UPI003F51FBD2
MTIPPPSLLPLSPDYYNNSLNSNFSNSPFNNSNFTQSSLDDNAVGGGEEFEVKQKVQMVLGMIGTLGNFLLVHCFFRKKPKHPSDYFILAFSLTDLGFCMTMSSLNCVRWVTGDFHLASFDDPNHYRCTANLFIYSLKTMCSLLILAAMTLNRWCAVCRPHYYKNVFSTRKVRIFLSCIVLFASVRSCPYVLACWLGPIAHRWGNDTAENVQKVITYGVFLWVKSGLVFFDAILMMVAYPMIGWRLRSMTNRRRQQTRGIRLADSRAFHSDCPSMQLAKKDQITLAQGQQDKAKQLLLPPPPPVTSNQTSSPNHSGLPSQSPATAMNITVSRLGPCKKMAAQRNKLTSPMMASNSRMLAPNDPSVAVNNQDQQQSHRPSDSAVTATLFLVCSVFMLLMIPDSILEFCHMYNIGPKLSQEFMLWTTVLFNFYFVINPLLYYFSNKYFQCYINNIFRKSAI